MIRTPLGFASIKGDENGIVSVSVSDYYELMLDPIVPEVLQDTVYQLDEYFSGKRKNFSLVVNPPGSEFQKNV